MKRAGWLAVLVPAILVAIYGAGVWAQELPEGKSLNRALERRLAVRKQVELQSKEAPSNLGVTQSGASTSVEAERGDVLSVGGHRYRLWGVAAPAPNEFGGYTSAQELKRLLAGGRISCVTTGELADDLPLARCKVDGKDIAAIMVAGGFARDCPRQSRGTYAAVERGAVTDVAGGFDLPLECLED